MLCQKDSVRFTFSSCNNFFSFFFFKKKKTIFCFSGILCYTCYSVLNVSISIQIDHIKAFESKSFLPFQLFDGGESLFIFTLRASGLVLIFSLDVRKDIQWVKSAWSILHSELKYVKGNDKSRKTKALMLTNTQTHVLVLC